MLATPVATGCSHAALDFVEDKKHLVLVADAAKRLEPFAAKMIVAAFALDRLYDDRRDVDAALGDELHDLLLALFLARDHVLRPVWFGQREIDGRIGNARPVELREQIGLARIGVREAHRITAAAMKGLAEMQNLRAAFPSSRRDIFADLPIH